MSEQQPPCPTCETDLLVASANTLHFQWKCHGCSKRWGKQSIEPIDYNDVDEWFEAPSSDGTRLHANRDCIGQCSSVISHNPKEAETHRHPRCITCGHEVVA